MTRIARMDGSTVAAAAARQGVGVQPVVSSPGWGYSVWEAVPDVAGPALDQRQRGKAAWRVFALLSG